METSLMENEIWWKNEEDEDENDNENVQVEWDKNFIDDILMIDRVIIIH